MLRSMLLDGFRSFDGNVAVSFAPLTLLAGANNVGKSSVIQALLAFVQSEQMQSGDGLLLNGLWVELGGFDQVLNAGRSSTRRSFTIGLAGETASGNAVDTLWCFEPRGDPAQPVAAVGDVEYSRQTIQAGDTIGHFRRGEEGGFEWEEELTGPQGQQRSSRGEIMSFAHPGQVSALLSAQDPDNPLRPGDRGIRTFALAPMDVTRTSHVGPFRAPPQQLYAPRASPLGPPLGRHGEHTAEILFRGRTNRVKVLPPGLATVGDPQPILTAINAWWSHIFDGSLALQINAPARLGYTLAVDTPSAERLGLGQVGLGLSQTLPIVAACLTSNPGDLLLFETPEAHLHPGAQHRLTSLFVELARRGRQVVVETHSEHLLHAAYLAVKAGLLSLEDVAISFFEQQDGRTTVQRIDVDPQGRALQAPKGFFDQAAIDLAELLR